MFRLMHSSKPALLHGDITFSPVCVSANMFCCIGVAVLQQSKDDSLVLCEVEVCHHERLFVKLRSNGKSITGCVIGIGIRQMPRIDTNAPCMRSMAIS